MTVPKINNFLNMRPEDLDRPVYRIMPVERILEIIATHNLVLVNPRLWDDPFENALLHATFHLPNGKGKGKFAARNAMYGQCWTWKAESDAMWRIYSPGKDGIRMMSTPRKLLSALYMFPIEFPEFSSFIGEVKYIATNKLQETLGAVWLAATNGAGFAQSMLHKRMEFAHEEEVRLIYSGAGGDEPRDFLSISISPNEAISELTMDPRMNIVLVDAYENALRKRGFVGEINQSNLYNPPEEFNFPLHDITP